MTQVYDRVTTALTPWNSLVFDEEGRRIEVPHPELVEIRPYLTAGWSLELARAFADIDRAVKEGTRQMLIERMFRMAGMEDSRAKAEADEVSRSIPRKEGDGRWYVRRREPVVVGPDTKPEDFWDDLLLRGVREPVWTAALGIEKPHRTLDQLMFDAIVEHLKEDGKMDETMVVRRCLTCQYSKIKYGGSDGLLCLRFPPPNPKVDADDVCGEWATMNHEPMLLDHIVPLGMSLNDYHEHLHGGTPARCATCSPAILERAQENTMKFLKEKETRNARGSSPD